MNWKKVLKDLEAVEIYEIDFAIKEIRVSPDALPLAKRLVEQGHFDR